MFVSKAGIESRAVESCRLQNRIEVVKDCRQIGKKDMKFNDTTPRMTVDPESFVRLPGWLKVPRWYLHGTDDPSFERRPLQPIVSSIKRRPRLRSPLSEQYFLYRPSRLCHVTATV
ncbi:hypothetical protein GJ744_011449 [Endocarpon pusillum]|uniref:Urease domain-containing protein n=1 Tax=Endocarpon pusillum TaxID=364733 RepID=A0A8H7E2X3_9EURO|nr:hypothetical protein GJ744_011449 [Endocarpon pusillum]